MDVVARRDATVVVAIPSEVRARLFDERSWRRLTKLADVRIAPADGDLSDARAQGLLREAEIVVIGWGTRVTGPDWIDAAPRLRAVLYAAGSVRPFVSHRAFERGIQVSTQAEYNGIPVAEYTLAMILLAQKSVFSAQHRFRTSREAFPISALRGGNYGARVGIWGASRIGRRLLGMLAPFDLETLVSDPYLTAADAQRLDARRVPLDELFARCGVVSLHAPLLDATRGTVDAALLRLLPDGATLINTARGGLVDLDALTAEVASGRINAVLDVTEPEVLPAASPLWDLPNVVLTPHLAGSAGNEVRRLGNGTIDELERFLAGQRLLFTIDPDHFAVMA